MTRLQPLQLENDAIVYIQVPDAPEEIAEPEAPAPELTRDSLNRGAKGIRQDLRNAVKAAIASPEVEIAPTEPAQPLKDTIRNYTDLIVSAFKEVSSAEVKTLKLEFGVELGGKLGVPYIADASAKSTLKVAVECVFPTSADDADEQPETDEPETED